jgi:prepilin-type N-terminal cleavage/methylation domain-containing protein
MKKGYTLVEMLVVVAIITVLALVSIMNFTSRRNQTHLSATASSMVALLREAQSRSVSQLSSTVWGVHFENSTTTSPFFSLFSTTYSSSSHVSYYALPTWVGYDPSSIAPGSFAEVRFAQISGSASGSSSISIYLIQGGSQGSSTISISGAGAISY